MLRIDLFDLVDGLFRGVVYFFYNIFETIVHLVRRPFRGPLRLYRKRRQPDVRQLAGPTFLFLSFAAFFAVYHIMLARHENDEAEGEAAIGDQLTAAVTSTPSLDADWLWLVLATSLAATVVVDASLRLALSSPGFGTRARRALVQEGVEYALFWPILLLLVLSLRPETLYPLQSAMLAQQEALDLGFIPFFLLALMPAALLLAAGPRSARRRAPGALPLLRLASLAAMAVIMFAAALAGAWLGNTIVQQRQEQRMAAFDQGLLVFDLDCALAGPVPHVAAVIWHRGTEPVVLQALNLRLYIATRPDNYFLTEEDREGAVQHAIAFDDPPGRSLLIQPGEARRVRLLVPGYRYTPSDANKGCGLEVDTPTDDAATAQSRPLGGIADTIDPPAEP